MSIILKRKRVLYTFLILAFLLLGASIVYWRYVTPQVIAIFEYPTDVTITEKLNSIGIGIRKDELHFGIIHAGREARSGVIATNNGKEFVRVLIYPVTNFSDWLVFSETDFVLAPQEERLVSVNVTPPIDAGIGKYSGKVVAVFQKVTYRE